MTLERSYASSVDVTTHGTYRIAAQPGDTRPRYRFGGVTADGPSGYTAEAGRYHVYAGSERSAAPRASSRSPRRARDPLRLGKRRAGGVA